MKAPRAVPTSRLFNYVVICSVLNASSSAWFSFARFEVYQNDFGWGKPVRVINGCNNKFDGMVNICPGKDEAGSVDVDIALLPQKMNLLECDAEFLM
ncbi:hypothetical protein KI387_027311, partial [Taxus chinensis]